MKFQFGASKCIFGEGSSLELSSYFAAKGCRHLLCVCDEGVKKAGIVGPVIEALRAAGIDVTVFDKVVPDPTVEIAEQAGQAARDCGADGVLAVGGGSPIDTAKLAAVLGANPVTVRELCAGREIPGEPLPFVAVPTTSGTGSEVTPAAVVTDQELNRKVTLVNDKLRPACAVLDPALTLGLPKGATAATGIDALSHAMESMTCVLHNPLTDGLALQAIRLLAEYLPRCVADGTDREARSKVMLAATMAGMAFGNTAAHAGHALAHAMGAHWHIPHGVACGLALPFAVTVCAPAAGDQLRQIAEALGIADGEELGDWTARFSASLGIPTLRQLGIQREQLDEVVKACMKERMLMLSGVPVSEEMCRAYFEKIIEF